MNVLRYLTHHNVQHGRCGSGYRERLSLRAYRLSPLYLLKTRQLLDSSKSDSVRDDELYMDLLSQGPAMGPMSSIVSIDPVMLLIFYQRTSDQSSSARKRQHDAFSVLDIPIRGDCSSDDDLSLRKTFGANKPHRIAKGIRQGSLVAFGWAILVCIFLFFASPALNELISGSSDPVLLDNAALYEPYRVKGSEYPFVLLLILMK